MDSYAIAKGMLLHDVYQFLLGIGSIALLFGVAFIVATVMEMKDRRKMFED